MKVRKVIKIIEQDGWFLVRQRSTHRQYKHSFKRGNYSKYEGSHQISETKTMTSLSAPARRQAGTGRPDRSRNLKWRRKQCLN